MPNAIELLAADGSTLAVTLDQAVGMLSASGIQTLDAGQILSGDDPPFGRIVLQNLEDKESANRILAESGFNLR